MRYSKKIILFITCTVLYTNTILYAQKQPMYINSDSIMLTKEFVISYIAKNHSTWLAKTNNADISKLNFTPSIGGLGRHSIRKMDKKEPLFVDTNCRFLNVNPDSMLVVKLEGYSGDDLTRLYLISAADSTEGIIDGYGIGPVVDEGSWINNEVYVMLCRCCVLDENLTPYIVVYNLKKEKMYTIAV